MSTTRVTPKKQQANDLEAISRFVAASPSDKEKKLFTTSKIMIGLARAQHKVPLSVKDNNPALVTMVVIEHQARKLETKKLDSIDHALTGIKEEINRINPETREEVQIKDQYENKVKSIQLDYKIISAKKDKLQHDLDHSKEKKDKTFEDIAKKLGEGKEPDHTALSSVKSNFTELEQQSKTIAKESTGFNYKIDNLKTEVLNAVQAIEGPAVGGYRPGE